MRIDELRSRSREIEESRDSLVPTTRPETPHARRSDPAAHLPITDRGRASPDLVAFVANAVSAAVTEIDGGQEADRATKRLDALRDAYAGPYTVKEDGQTQTVRAPAMFRMGNGANSASARDPVNVRQLEAVGKTVGLSPSDVARARLGLASPAELQKLTQGMIDAGMLPDGADLASRIRTMQWHFGIGIECATYTRFALSAVTGKRGSDLGLAPLGTENFRELGDNGAFRKIVKIETVRPGDVITLDPLAKKTEPGHNVIVRSANALSETDKQALLARHGSAGARLFAGEGTVVAIEVDSAWGAGAGGASYGGVRRDTWYFDPSSKLWGFTDPSTSPPTFKTSRFGPANDELRGAYRPKVSA